MAANEDEVRLRLTAETLGYRKAWADVRVQTARDLASIKSTVTTSLNQTRVNAAQSLAGIRQSAVTNLGQARVTTAQQLAQIRVNTAQQLQAIRQNAAQTLGQMGSQFESAGRRLSVGLTLPLVALAAASVRSAKDIDAQVNVLRAFTGSAEAAEARLRQLNATALKTPGLTTTIALQFDAQLRSLRVTEQAINSILPAIGRLNAVKQIEDPQRFTENLVQLITTDFQKRDLRELVRASPVAGQVLAELFNVDSPTNAEAIRKAAKRMGVTTVDAFFTAFADAASRNEGLARVTESIGTRFEKLHDRVRIALRPLGLAIVEALTPLVDVGVPAVEALGRAFNSLPTPLKTTVVLIGGFAAALGPALFITGSLINTVVALQKAYVALNALALIPTISNLRLLGQVMQGTASLSAGAGATAAVAAAGWIALAAAAVAAVTSAGYAMARFDRAGTEQERREAKWVRALLPIISPLAALGYFLGSGAKKTEEFGDAQSDATGPLRDFAGGVDEEIESLKQLKRALAEVEIATKARVAAAQRAYNEGRISAAQYAEERVRANEDDRDVQLKLIDENQNERSKKIEGLERTAQGPISPEALKDLKATKEESEKAKLERKRIVSESETEIKNIRSEARQKEKELAERHRDTLVQIQREEAEGKIAVLQDALERDESLRKNNTAEIINLERGITNAEEGEIRARLKLEAEGTEARKRIQDELDLFLKKKRNDRKVQERRQRDADLAEDLRVIRRAAAEAQTADLGDQGLIERIREGIERSGIAKGQIRVPSVERDAATGRLREVERLADTEVRTYEGAERLIKDIVDRGYERRIKNLQAEIDKRREFGENVEQMEADKARLEQERQNAREEGDRRVTQGRETDLEVGERQIQQAERLTVLERTLASARLSVREALLKTARSVFTDETKLINERYDVEAERLKLALDEQLDQFDEQERADIEAARKTLKRKEDFEVAKKELEDRYRGLRRAAEDEARARDEANERERGRELELKNPTSGRSLLGDDFADAANETGSTLTGFAAMARGIFADLSADAGNFGTMLTDVFSQLGNAVGSVVKNFVLFGTAGMSFKKFAAEVIASIAQMAVVKAVWEGAEAAAMFALAWFTGNPKFLKSAHEHLWAAGAYAAVAGAAIGIGRGVAGKSFAQAGGGGTAASALGEGEGPRNKEFQFGVGSTPASEDAGGRAQGRGLVGGPLAEVLNRIDTHMDEQRKINAMQQAFTARVTSHIESLGVTSHEQIVTIGATGAREAIATAVLDHSGSDDGWNDGIARNLRVP